MILMGLVFFLISTVFRPPPLNWLAIIGVLSGMGGAGFLYWEPMLTDEEAAEFVAMFLRVDRDTRVTRDDLEPLFLIAPVPIFVVGVLVYVLSLHPWTLASFLWIGGVVFACLCILGALYMVIRALKAADVARARDAANLGSHEERVSFAKLKLRTWGFASLLAAGALQIPLLLAS